MALRCIDCTKIDLQDQNKWGEYYCFETRSYVRGDSYTCRWFDQRDLGGCYLTTAFCHILGYKDDCYELEILRPEIVINRITGDPKVSDLVEPSWLVKKFTVLNEIDKEMVKRDS